MLLGCTGLFFSDITREEYPVCLLFVLPFILAKSSMLHDRKPAVLEPLVGIKSGNNNSAMFLAADLQVSILRAAMGEQNDLANDAREGPFRTRWISLLGTLSKRQ